MRLLATGGTLGTDADFFVAAIKKISVFSFLSDWQMRKVFRIVKTVEFEDGETVFKKGELGDSFFVIKEGGAKAVAKGFFRMKTLKSMGPGETFGLLGLTLKKPRAATISCVGKTVCFVLEGAELELLRERDQDISSAFKKVVHGRFQK